MPPKKPTVSVPAATVPAAAATAVPAKVATAITATLSKPAPAKPAAVPVAPATGVDETVEVEEDSLNQLLEKFGSIQTMLKEFHTQLKAHQKVFNKLQKQSKKAERKRAAARKTQSGFAKPSKLSDELCDFLKVDRGTEMARTAVTKLITNYIKTNNLNDKTNKRKIIPDAPLQKLLNYKAAAGDELTYFNLQRYMKHQFVKATAATTEA